ncbi:MAG: PRC-barrel domain-containing protein [Aquihabitans sp.]
MRLSDLLGAEVLDADGAVVGRVRDARLVQDGPMQGTFGAGLRLVGLIVGPAALGSRLGFRRSGVDAPAIVARPLRILDATTRYVPWESVVEVEGRCIRLDRRAAELERMLA